MTVATSRPQYFPDPATAPRAGLMAVGGALRPDRLLDAYRHGIFPWPGHDGTVAWWSPDPRATIEFDRFHVSRRLARTIASGKFELTRDQDFKRVIYGCATVGDREGQTWITLGMRAAYNNLHA